jgi:hypothetical protein
VTPAAAAAVRGLIVASNRATDLHCCLAEVNYLVPILEFGTFSG